MKARAKHRDVQSMGAGYSWEDLKPRKVGGAMSLTAMDAMLWVGAGWLPPFYSGASGGRLNPICGRLLQKDRIR